MKLEYKCKVVSKTYIGHSNLEALIDEKRFILVPDTEGLLKEILVTVQVRNSQKITSRISPSSSPKAKHEINIEIDKDLDREITELLQYLESSLSFSASLEKISWEEPELRFVAENEDEKTNVNVLSFAIHKGYPEDRKILTLESFREIITSREKYDFLTVVKSFFREGKREFNSFRYINAFYNFYYIIEDLYGRGKTKNHDIETSFKNDKDFRSFVEWMLTKNLEGRHKKNIEKFLAEENKTYDVDGLIELIVKVRGNLHHFSTKSSKHKGTPLNHHDFESIAFLLMGLSVRSIFQKIYERNKGLI